MDAKLLAVSPLAIENVYHVAYLVPDLLRAMESLGERLQIEWAPPFEMESEFHTPDGGKATDPARIVYSSQGPPYLELIEVVARPGSIFAEPATGGFHHLGVYAERWRDEMERMREAGMIVEGWGFGTAFVRDPELGVRYEIVSFKGRDFLTRILNGELAAEHPLRERSGPR